MPGMTRQELAVIAPEQALQKILDHAQPLEAEPAALAQCAGRILAQDLSAGENLLRPGENILRRAEDVRRSDLLLKKGSLLRPYEIALLAAQGFEMVPVIRRPIVAILATGDELIDASKPLSRGKIRNCNGPAISGALSRWNLASMDLGISRDDPDELEAALKPALARADVVVISGCASVGDFDHAKSALRRLGAEDIFWKLAIKPGEPFLFAVHRSKPGGPLRSPRRSALGPRSPRGAWGASGTMNRRRRGGRPLPIFGLPGNPVAALICLEEFIRPALEKMQGYAPKHPSYHLRARAVNGYDKPSDRREYLFCRASLGDGDFKLHILRQHGAAMMGAACSANALAAAPPGGGRIQPGDWLPFRWLK
ncbi:MAG: molybdopterin molybdotransferase MoeA [Elusimicrobia bacterium]|nr:molybdopterin molybdotransferase MoeA [Elusimicrobiota bacterium]